MESTLHVDWGLVLLNAARHTRASSDDLVTGNVAFAPDDGQPHSAPDVMVLPGQKGNSFGRYEPGPDGPMPSVCVEILSPSNTAELIERRIRRLLGLGVGEVYVLDPRRDTIVQVTLHEGRLIESTAIGSYSKALSLSFVRVGGHLAVCCPAGRIVRPGDDPFGWLVEETARADAAEAKVDAAEAKIDAAETRATVAEAELARLQAEVERLRAGPPS